jgi:hypothetical protein
MKEVKEMTNTDVIEIAMAQSAIDSNCRKEDFKSNENKVVISAKNSDARRYLELPFYCDLTSYGNNIVASVSDELAETVSSYICKYSYIHCLADWN